MDFAMKILCLAILAAVLDLNISTGNNLDIESPIVLSPESQVGIEFGFSLGMFLNETHKRLLVGAPSANTFQDVSKPGALYECKLGHDFGRGKCSQLVVDIRNSTDKYQSFITEEVKDYQRLGSSLATKDNRVMVCAPNWHYFEKRGRSMIDTPVGICYKSSNLDNFEAFSAPFDVKLGTTITYVTTGSCQSGFSAALTKDDAPVLGSPGCYNWKGDVWVEDGSKWITRRTSQEAIEESDTDYDKYTGYSVATGTFGDREGIVAAMPRTTPTHGRSDSKLSVPMVGIFELLESKLSLWATLSPPMEDNGMMDPVWLFSYFGYSLAVGDIDGNGLDDVVVGAPFYRNATHPDQGAILVFTQIRELLLTREERIRITTEAPFYLRLGDSKSGRFGSAVSCLGDIDGDGISDIGVGAPYTSDGGRVYIYLGNKGGLSDTPNQVITASENALKDYPMSTFGFAIAETFQFSRRGQNDLAVGAFEADRVVLYKSNPVLTIDWSVTFSEEMDLTSTCPSDGFEFPCTTVVVCLSYGFLGSERENVIRTRDFKVRISLDPIFSRLRFDDFSDERKFSFSIDYKDEEKCQNQNIYAIASQENLQPYEILAEVSFFPKEYDKATLDFRAITTAKELLQVKIECETGDISTCVSDLKLSAQPRPKIVDIEYPTFKITFRVQNSGETSYYNNLVILLPDHLQVSGIVEILEESSIQPNIECTASTSSKSKIDCALGTFINNGDEIVFEVPFGTTSAFMDVEILRQHPKVFQIQAEITSLSEMKDSELAKAEIFVEITAHPRVDLSKDPASTEIIHYNDSSRFVSPNVSKSVEDIGPIVTHSFKVYNPQSYAIEDIEIIIYWPLYIQDHFLLYVEERPDIPGVSVAYCSIEKKSGAALEEMSGLPLVEDIRWFILSCPRAKVLPKEDFSVAVISRFVQRTVAEIEKGTLLNEVKSFIFIKSKPILLGEIYRLESSNSMETDISYDYSKPSSSQTPAWAIVVGILIGLVLLMIVSCILRKFDFFKRKKKPTNELPTAEELLPQVHEETSVPKDEEAQRLQSDPPQDP